MSGLARVAPTAGPLDAFKVTGSSPTPSARDVPYEDSVAPYGDERHVAFSVYGRRDAPIVVVLGGISAHRTVAGDSGWWRDAVGPSRPLDPQDVRVVSIDYLGGVGDSWGSGGEATPAEQAEAVCAALDAIGAERAAAVIGASYGGLVALAFAAEFPDRLDRLITIAAAHRTHPMASALRSIQRSIAALGVGTDQQAEALGLARQLAMTTYRTAREFSDRFDGRHDQDPGAQAVAYLASRGASFAQAFDTATFLRLSATLDRWEVDPARISAPATVIGIPSDQIAPSELIRELATSLAGPVDLRWVEARTGHDGFLTEATRIADLIARALASDSSECALRSTTVRAGIGRDTAHGAVMPPIYLSANYAFPAVGTAPEFDYSRSGNPTRAILTDAIADLEAAAGGVATSSGMAACTVLLHTLDADALVVAPTDCYGGTRRLLDALDRSGRIRVAYVDLWDADEIPRWSVLGPALVWIETPSNPLLRISDVSAISTAARAVGAVVAVDNTFLSPALQRPLLLGADYVLHSTTKLINGHSDVVGGGVFAADPDRAEALSWWGNCLGVTGAPFDAYQTLRGLRTLRPRVRSHLENTARVVEALAGHPAVSVVHYPGLPEHPGHEIAARQQTGFGSVVSFELEGGEPAVRSLARSVELFTLAESLGGVESLLAHPATMTHAAMTPEARAVAGISEGLVRISIGIEDPDDLAADLTRALDVAGRRAS